MQIQRGKSLGGHDTVLFDLENKLVWRFTGEGENVKWIEERAGGYKETYQSVSGASAEALIPFKPTLRRIGWFNEKRQEREIAFEHAGRTYFWYAQDTRFYERTVSGLLKPTIVITNGEEIFVASSPQNALDCLNAIRSNQTDTWSEHSMAFEISYLAEGFRRVEKTVTVHYGDCKRRMFGTDLVRFVDVRNGVKAFCDEEFHREHIYPDIRMYSERGKEFHTKFFTKVDFNRRLILAKFNSLEEAVKDVNNVDIIEVNKKKFVVHTTTDYEEGASVSAEVRECPTAGYTEAETFRCLTDNARAHVVLIPWYQYDNELMAEMILSAIKGIADKPKAS